MKIGVLQISDLHIENENYIDKIELIINACEYDIKEISHLYVLIIGDIAKTGRKEEYDSAIIFIQTIESKLKSLKSILQVKFIIVPGNHDCCFDNEKSTRELVLDKCLQDVIEDKDYIDAALSVQDNFWEFYKKIMGEIPNDKISFEISDRPSINQTIVFHCYNSSWMSRKKERYGNIVIPENKFLKNNGKNIVFSLFHHPFAWLSPETRNNNKSRFEEHLISSSNFILFGHEHDKGQPKCLYQKSNNTIISEGKAFQTDDLNKIGFNYMEVDLETKKNSCKVYSWDKDQYIVETEETFELLEKGDRPFSINEEFAYKIDNLSIPLKHSKKEKLTLSDVFIFPDLEPLIDSNIIQYPDSIEILNTIKDKIKIERKTDNTNDAESEKDLKVVIEGEDQSGKTTLLFAFYKELYEIGALPIYLKGKNINNTNVKDIVKKAMKEQYQSSDVDLFFQQKNRVLLLDNYHKSTLNSKHKSILLKNLSSHFQYIIFTTNTTSISNLATEEVTILNDFDKYKILPLGHQKRGDLIRQWLTIGENHMTIREEELLKTLQTRLDEINILLGNRLMPSYPIFILTLLQGLDAQIFPHDYSHTSYGHCYHALITAGLVKEGLKDDIDSYLNLLKELAFFIYDKKIQSFFDLKIYEEFIIEFKKSYYFNSANQQVLQNLTNANILRFDDEHYSFSYKYIYYYLISQKISSNIEKHEKLIEELCSNIHLEHNANILIFLSHHSKAQLLLDNILFSSELPFEDVEPITLDRDDPFSKFISKFVEIVQNNIIEERNPEEEVRNELKRKDEIERIDSVTEDTTEGLEIPPEILEINQAFRTIKILGQIVKNQKGDFEKEKLEALVESAYRTCFRFVNFFTGILQKEKDFIIEAIIEELKKKNKNPMQQFDKEVVAKGVLTFLQFISYRICIDSFTDLMFSIGTRGVNELYESVAEQIDTPAAKIVTFAVKSYYGNINVPELERLFKSVENNYIAQSILRLYVKKHLYTNLVDRIKREQIIKIAGFKPNVLVGRTKKYDKNI